MEIKLKLKISDDLEIELSEQQSKELYEILKRLYNPCYNTIQNIDPITISYKCGET